MNNVSVIFGALHYEFSMQIRRRAVWLVLLLMSTFIFILWYAFAGPALLHGYYSHGADHPTPVWIAPQPRDAVLYLAQFAAWFLPIGCGLMLADRIARDYTLHVNEVLDTLPGSLAARLLGKYLGSTLATLLPTLLIYSLGIAYIVSQAPDLQLLPLALEAFLAILLPGILFAAGFSIALPIFMKVPIYQVLFILYWFWANLMSPRFHIPTLVDTMLNATGPWAQEAFFHFQWVFLKLNPTVGQGMLSIALLISTSLTAIVLAWLYLQWKYARR